ncbi:MAG: phage tail sheath family protein, partial [Lachnospiraceae bacterium]|nr:phage tail sheath family protein [Lachnospiraceae bacterium]
ADGTISTVNAGTFIGVDNGPKGRTGIQAFLENDVVNLLAVPGITIPEVNVALVSQCENLKNRFAVIDMPRDMTKVEDLIQYRNVISSTYAAMYHPWIQVFDRSSGKADFVPPSGAVLGVYARTDMTRGVHKAPANETVYCSGLSVNYTKDEQDLLNPEGINLIRTIPGEGIRVWGARTASSNSSFKYVNVRRLFIYVMESIKASTNWVVFEPNDNTLWQRVSMTISSFLEGMWRTGMLVGGSPGEAFFVEIGPGVTMTMDDIRSGRLICNIGIAPSRPAEFVIFRLTQHTSDNGGNGGGSAETEEV